MEASDPPVAPPPPYVPPPPLGDQPSYGGVPPEPPSGAAPLPWEQPGVPTLLAFFQTFRLVMLQPFEAFGRVSLTGAIWRPLLFGTVCIYVSAVFSSVYEFFVRRMMGDSFPGWMSGYDSGVALIATLVAGPLCAAVVIVLAAAIWHLILLLIGSGRSGYLASLRAMSYISAPALLGVIPVCGGLVGFVWQIVLTVIGMATIHRAPIGRVILALVLVLVVCCLCCSFPLFLLLKQFRNLPF